MERLRNRRTQGRVRAGAPTMTRCREIPLVSFLLDPDRRTAFARLRRRGARMAGMLCAWPGRRWRRGSSRSSGGKARQPFRPAGSSGGWRPIVVRNPCTRRRVRLAEPRVHRSRARLVYSVVHPVMHVFRRYTRNVRCGPFARNTTIGGASALVARCASETVESGRAKNMPRRGSTPGATSDPLRHGRRQRNGGPAAVAPAREALSETDRVTASAKQMCAIRETPLCWRGTLNHEREHHRAAGKTSRTWESVPDHRAVAIRGRAILSSPNVSMNARSDQHVWEASRHAGV